MAAFYNENDPYCSRWTRNLAAAGLVAPGHVDDRSIRDVRGSDLDGYTQAHFFAGVGLWSHALRMAGWPDDRPVWTGSCPCQPFSVAGAGKGYDDERHLWPDFLRLIDECRPPVMFGEQVASKAGRQWLADLRTDLEALGYAVGGADLCSAGVGAPNIRQRLFWVAYTPGGNTSSGWLQRGGKHGFGAAHGDAADRSRGTIRGSQDGRLAITQGEQRRKGFSLTERGDARDGAQRARKRSGLDGAVGGMAIADSPGFSARIGASASLGHGSSTQPDGDVRGMGDSARVGSPTGTREPDGGYVTYQPERSGDDSRLGDSLGRRLSNTPAPLSDGAGRERLGTASGGASRPLSPWSRLEWIDCLDGKRRPVESGVLAMVAGYSARVARPRAFPLAVRQKGDVAKIRAYGNAINPFVAAEFIRAVMDVIG